MTNIDKRIKAIDNKMKVLWANVAKYKGTDRVSKYLDKIAELAVERLELCLNSEVKR